MLCALIFALLLVGYPSTSTLAGSATSSSAAVGTNDQEQDASSGSTGGNGGGNQGDADGLGGLRGKAPGAYGDGNDLGVVLRTWWKLLVWPW